MQTILKQWDIDLHQLWTLLRLAIKLDIRVIGTHYQQWESKASKFAFLWTLLAYLMFSLFFCIFIPIVRDMYTFFFILLTYTMVMMAMAVLVEFYSIVIYPDDMEILGPRPISSTTYFAAKLINLSLYVTLLMTSLTVIPVLAAVFRVKFWIVMAPFVFLVCISAGLTSAFLVIFIYTYLMTKIYHEKLQTILGYLQMVFSFVIFGGYQLIASIFRDSFKRGFTFSDIPFLRVTPMGWYAGFCDLLYGNINYLNIIMAFCAMAFSFLIAWLGIQRISRTYLESISAQKLEMKSQLTTREKISWTHQISQYIANPDTRVGFTLVSLYLRRDRRLRMMILPLFGIVLFYYFFGLFTQQKEFGVVDLFTVTEWQQVFSNMMFFIFVPLVSGSSLSAIRYSQDWQASWIYYTTPVNIVKFYNGAVLSVYAWIIFPLWIFTSVLFSFKMPVHHAFIQTFIIFILADIYGVLGHLLLPHLPLSNPMSTYGRQGRLVAVFLVTSIISIGILVLEYIAFRSIIGTSILLIFLMVIVYGLHLLDNLRIHNAYSKFEFVES